MCGASLWAPSIREPGRLQVMALILGLLPPMPVLRFQLLILTYSSPGLCGHSKCELVTGEAHSFLLALKYNNNTVKREPFIDIIFLKKKHLYGVLYCPSSNLRTLFFNEPADA